MVIRHAHHAHGWGSTVSLLRWPSAKLCVTPAPTQLWNTYLSEQHVIAVVVVAFCWSSDLRFGHGTGCAIMVGRWFSNQWGRHWIATA